MEYEDVMPTVDGHPFRCTNCGANVFSRVYCEFHDQDEFKCKGCGYIYG